MAKKVPRSRPFGDSIGPIEDFDEVCERLRAGLITPTILRRTLGGLVAFLQSVARPDSLTPGISDAESYNAKCTIELIVKVYREAKEGRVRT